MAPTSELRAAREDDAVAAAKVLRDSIRELCFRDHGDEEEPLRQWLANKTPELVAQWFDNRDNVIIVADVSGEIGAVGGIRRDGYVLLNYVAPALRFQGLSKRIMAELERLAIQSGLACLTLDSTVTAHRFYLALGYQDAGEPGKKHGLTNYPMRKTFP